MGFVTVETVISKNKAFTMEIETAGLYQINCGLCKILAFPGKVLKVSVADGILLVLTEDRDFRDGSDHAPILKDNRQINNIDAYDWQGNHLWNIGELVGDIKIQFDWLNHISARDIKKYYGVRCARSDSLYACIAEGFVYIIDAKKQLLLTKISGQIR